MASKGKPEVLGARDAVDMLPPQKTLQSEGAHHVPQHTICQKTSQSQTAPSPQSAERLARDRRQAQRAATVLEQALEDLGLPADLVAEIEGRLRSQQQLLGKIVGVMFPPLFGCRTNAELCRVRGWDKNLPSRLLWGAAQALLAQAAPTLGSGGAGTAVALRRQQE